MIIIAYIISQSFTKSQSFTHLEMRKLKIKKKCNIAWELFWATKRKTEQGFQRFFIVLKVTKI